ncbi:MAG TPA: PQQ-dependent sugar dehydrogenase [Thermoanaerobaculia bacterium]|nr:PQQ-dependent sugar dehydrogenase [Thermoanaerobaculia bacterium]
MRLTRVAATAGFVTSLAIDSRNRLWYSTTDGGIYRIEGTDSVLLTRVETANEGNAALLGIAFRSDDSIVAHYVTPTISADVLAEIDSNSAATRELARFNCMHWSSCLPEHHGGNPVVGPDDSVYVPIGDWDLPFVYAQRPDWPAGKIHRVQRDGTSTMYALGFRNPFDLVVDATTGKLIVPDNGSSGQDEINIVSFGDNGGWPYGEGTKPSRDGMLAPAYVFAPTVAPTGTISVSSLGGYARGGMLLAAYVTKTLYYIPDPYAVPMPDPIPLIDTEGVSSFGARRTVPQHTANPVEDPLIDVVQSRDGSIYVATPTTIYKVTLPQAGDANGDGTVDRADLEALDRELTDGAVQRTIDAQRGNVAASWGADVNADGTIDAHDRAALLRRLATRRRSVRH